MSFIEIITSAVRDFNLIDVYNNLYSALKSVNFFGLPVDLNFLPFYLIILPGFIIVFLFSFTHYGFKEELDVKNTRNIFIFLLLSSAISLILLISSFTVAITTAVLIVLSIVILSEFFTYLKIITPDVFLLNLIFLTTFLLSYFYFSLKIFLKTKEDGKILLNTIKPIKYALVYTWIFSIIVLIEIAIFGFSSELEADLLTKVIFFLFLFIPALVNYSYVYAFLTSPESFTKRVLGIYYLIQHIFITIPIHLFLLPGEIIRKRLKGGKNGKTSRKQK